MIVVAGGLLVAVGAALLIHGHGPGRDSNLATYSVPWSEATVLPDGRTLRITYRQTCQPSTDRVVTRRRGRNLEVSVLTDDFRGVHGCRALRVDPAVITTAVDGLRDVMIVHGPVSAP